MSRRVAACGTRSGYNRHLRNHETPCNPCREANAAYRRQRTAGKPRRTIQHGTRAGYESHKRHRQYPCQPCVDAMRATWRAQRQARKAKR